MGTFELDNCGCNTESAYDSKKLKDECIIALKVYDFCRQQDCLTSDVLGPARAAEDKIIGTDRICEGEIIDPPANSATVTIENMKVSKIIVVNKKPSAFKRGFWELDIKYVFCYRLIFREADGTIIGSILANSIFNKKITLFGSIGSDISISTDMFNGMGNDCNTLDSDPFVLVEAKAVTIKRLQ